jgi:hypothetical protein
MTVHKAQGRTIDKVVLDLHYKGNHKKRLGFDGIFVAPSRVRCRSSIHLVKHIHTSFEKAYGYISKLKPAPDVMAFYRGLMFCIMWCLMLRLTWRLMWHLMWRLMLRLMLLLMFWLMRRLTWRLMLSLTWRFMWCLMWRLMLHLMLYLT